MPVVNDPVKKFALSPQVKQTDYDKQEMYGVVTPNMYKETYVFGEFSELFLPDVNNSDIAEHMTVIKDKLIGYSKNDGTKVNPQPVFMLGYGASGAGKTSSLIYFKNAENESDKNGILINLCNQMGKTRHFNKIELKCKEFYHTDPNAKLHDPTVSNSPEEGSISFTFKNGEFLLDGDYEHKTNHKYRLRNQEGDKTKTIFEADSKLGEVIIHLIDTDRFVKATTNNPNSSRSHTLVFVKLVDNTSKNPEGNIVIGDFAGVENAFACENPKIIQEFLTVKRDDKEGKPYYSTESDGTSIDPINGGGNFEDIKKKLYAMLHEIDARFKSSRLTARDPKNPENVEKKKNVKSTHEKYVVEFKGEINKILEANGYAANKIEDNLKFIPEAFFGQTEGIFEKAYKPVIDNLVQSVEGKAKMICTNRREEGYFINDSLVKVREVIKKILYEKNSDSINISPNFIDVCFENYCPNHQKCFNFDVAPSGSTEPKSVIFDAIREELGYKEQDMKQFYKDIIVSIFCVFNISRKANNPPPTPYIDVNLLKLLYYYKNFTKNFTYGNQFLEEGKRVISMIETVTDPRDVIRNTEGFGDKVAELKSIKSQRYIGTNRMDNFKTFIKLLEDGIKSKNTNPLNLSYEGQYKIYIKEFIDMIDKSNAVSAVGTLEFLDQLAKFNTVTTVCRKNEYLSDDAIDKFITKKGMVELYKDGTTLEEDTSFVDSKEDDDDDDDEGFVDTQGNPNSESKMSDLPIIIDGYIDLLINALTIVQEKCVRQTKCDDNLLVIETKYPLLIQNIEKFNLEVKNKPNGRVYLKVWSKIKARLDVLHNNLTVNKWNLIQNIKDKIKSYKTALNNLQRGFQLYIYEDEKTLLEKDALREFIGGKGTTEKGTTEKGTKKKNNKIQNKRNTKKYTLGKKA